MQENSKKSVAALILAAGESKRMNFPKPFLKFDARIRFIDKIVQEYEDFGCNEIIVVINENIKDKMKFDNNIKIIINEHVDYGRFYSLKTGLKEINNSDFCFIQNIDNPFVNIDILNTLYNFKIEYGCVIPTYEGSGGHPVLIAKKIIENINSEERNDLNFREFLKQYNSKRIKILDDSILLNINTKEDYYKHFKNVECKM